MAESSKSKTEVLVTGPFDDIRSEDVRFLEEAAKLGPVTVLLWPDEAVKSLPSRLPKFPLAERLYFLNAVRHVARAVPYPGRFELDALPEPGHFQRAIWADRAESATPARRSFCRSRGLEYAVIGPEQMKRFPEGLPPKFSRDRKKVVVTGCYDWLHSGHVRFFEEVSAYGDLIVIVGHDENIRLLKGPGHPLLPAEERRYMTGSIRHVSQALISTGEGWLDAAPEIQRLKPDIYAVNEDGDKAGKREYCAEHGIEYLVLKRMPAPGLPTRTSTNLRGF